MTVLRVTVPKWGLSMKTGRILAWLVEEGTEVSEGTELAEIDTDKITGVLESAHAGVLRRIVAPVGSEVAVGAAIAIVASADTPEEEISAAAAEARARLTVVEEDSGTAFATVEVEGRSICYATAGEGGEVVVLVHGYGGDKDSWLFVQESLAHRHTVHALDLPGHGASTKQVDGFDTLVGAVSGFVEAVGGAVHLVGHSLGGAVATAVAAARPDRVRSLTLVAPAGYGPIDADYVTGFAEATTRRELRPHVARLFTGEVPRQVVDDLLRYKRLDGVGGVLKTLAALLPDLNVRSLRAELGLPLVVVRGQHDQIVTYPDPDARVVEAAGHMLHLEAPAAVIAAIETAIATSTAP